MTIAQVKAALPMRAQLARHGLAPDRAGMLPCPFHRDRTPSMQCFDDSQTVYCHSTNCRRHGKPIDVIDLEMHLGGLTKAEAIHRCKEVAAGGLSAAPAPKPAHVSAKPDPTDADPAAGDDPGADLPRAAVLQKAFAYFTRGLPATAVPRDYLATRGLDYLRLGERGAPVGYNSGQIHQGRRRDEDLIRSLLSVGLLSESPTGRRSRAGRTAYRSFGAGYLAFALRGAGGQVEGLYFRRVDGDGAPATASAPRHLYLRGRRGLYPGYPAPETTRLLLAESVVDAASFLQDEGSAAGWCVLALYGAGGYTAEHAAAVAALPALTEVCLALDGDAAGRAGAAKLAAALRAGRPGLTVSAVAFADGEDANAALVRHGPAYLAHAIEEREAVPGEADDTDAAPEHVEPTRSAGLPPSPDRRRHDSAADAREVDDPEPAQAPVPVPAPESEPASAAASRFDASRPHDLAFRGETCELRVKGLRDDQPDSLKITLQIRVPRTPPAR